MNDKTAKVIFWSGTLVSLALFLGLTIDTQARFGASTHPERLDERVLSGKRAFEHYNCNDCHTVLGFGAYYAPDLTRAYTRIGESGIRRRLLSPEVAFATSFRKMPRQGVTQQEADDITAYLRWVSDIDNHDWPPQDSKKRLARVETEGGREAAMTSPALALVEREACIDCHMLGSRGTPVGPRLDWIGARRDAEWIARYLADPQALAPGSEMPANDRLTPEERRTIGEFLVSLAPGWRR